MSVQLNQQTRSTRFSSGSLRDWYTWKCSLKNYRPKAVQTNGRLLPFMANQLNKSWLPSDLSSLPTPKGHTREIPALSQGRCYSWFPGWSHPYPSNSHQPQQHIPRQSHDLLHGFAEIPLPLYFPHHSALPNMHICLLPMREGEPFLALRARFPAIHQSLKVYGRH